MLRRGVVVVAAALALAGCGDDGAPTTTVPPGGAGGATSTTVAPGTDLGYDTCESVPAEVVNRNLGLALPEGSLAEANDPRTCEYGTYSFAGPPGNVLVTVIVANGTGQAQATFDEIVSVHSGQREDGVADDAAGAAFSSQYVVRQGNVVVNVFAVSGEARLGSTEDELRALAVEILGIGATLPGAVTTPAAAP